MDSYEWNKIFGAFLAVAFVVLGLTFLSEGIFHSDAPETAGFEIEGGEVEVAATNTVATADPLDMAMMASMEVSKGESVAKKCVACHNFNDGGANKVGPALYDIVNKPIAAKADFGYSAALKAYAEGKQWTYEELNGFLWKPKTHVKGTSMGFAGLKDMEDRVAIIAYLRSLSSNPAPLPES